MSNHSSTNFTYIDNDVALEAMCSQLSQCERIALDTEFIHRNTYFAKLALIQIGAQVKTQNKVEKQVYLVDPLKLTHAKSLIALLEDTTVEKIMHSPQQDREVLMHTYQVDPQPIFDTQLAAAFLGPDEQIGYQRLIAEKFSKNIDKLCTVSDWLKRPLTEDQLVYAVEDIFYLEELYVLLKEHLHQTQKIDWFEEESRLRQDKTFNYPKQFIKNIEHAPKSLIDLYQQLMEWREEKAQQRNLPRQWIISNLCIKNIVNAYKRDQRLSQQAIEQAIVRKRQSKKAPADYVEDIHALLGCIDPETLSFHGKAKSSIDKAELQALNRVMTNLAEQASIAPALIANKYHLVKILNGENYDNLSNNWRQYFIEQLTQTLEHKT